MRRDRLRNLLWAELMQRSFGFDVVACPRCGDRLRLIALIKDARVIRRILDHLHLPTDVRAARAARAPPLPELGHDADEAAVLRPAPARPARRIRGTTPTSTFPDRRQVVD